MKIFGIGLVIFLLFLIQRLVYEILWHKDLHVSVSFVQSGIWEEETGEILEIIENRKLLPLPMLKVKFQTSNHLAFLGEDSGKMSDQYYRNDIFQIGGGQRIIRKLAFKGKKRGYYHIKNIDLVASDLFLSNETIRSMKTESYLYVYPKIFKSNEFQHALQQANGEIIVRRHLMEDPFEYRGIREYQPYDDMRSVNWKATARTGALKVNQKNYTAMKNVRIFLNLEDDGVWKKHKEVEASMQIVMGIAAYFLAQGIKVACYANGRDIITDEHVEIAGGAGAGQLDMIGKALARIDTQKEAKDFCALFEERVLDSKDCMMNFFVSPNGYESFEKLMRTCEEKRIAFKWFYPTVSLEKESIAKEIRKNVQMILLTW